MKFDNDELASNSTDEEEEIDYSRVENLPVKSVLSRLQ